MPWLGNEETYEVKLQRLLDCINKYTAQGHSVSLVGASAGASAVLNAYVANPAAVTGVVLICPKINNPETVSKETYKKNPAFKESLERLQANLKKLTVDQKVKQIITYYSPSDGTIPYAGSTIPGVPERRLPAVKHGRAIVYAITFEAPSIMHFLKHQSRVNIK